MISRGFIGIFLISIVVCSCFAGVQPVIAQDNGYAVAWSWNFNKLNYSNNPVVISPSGKYVAASETKWECITYFFDNKGKRYARELGESELYSAITTPTGNIGVRDEPRSTPDGKYFAIADSQSNVNLFNEQGVKLWSYHIYSGASSLAITPDGNFIIVLGGYNSTIYLFNQKGNLLLETDLFHKYDLADVAITNDGNFIACIGGIGSGHALLLDNHGKLLWARDLDTKPEFVAISAGGKFNAVADGRTLSVFDRQGNLAWIYEDRNSISSLAISSDGSYFAVGGWFGTIDILDIQGILVNHLDTKTGQRIGKVSIASDRHVVAVTLDNSYFYPSDAVYYFDETGNITWSCDIAVDARLVGLHEPFLYTEVSADLSQIFIAVTGLKHSINFLSNDGSLLWNNIVDGSIKALIISDSEEIIVGTIYEVQFFNLEGKLLRNWRYEIDGNPMVVAISPNGDFISVFVEGTTTDLSGNKVSSYALYQFDRQGKSLWKHRIDWACQHLLVASDGTVGVENASVLIGPAAIPGGAIHILPGATIFGSMSITHASKPSSYAFNKQGELIFHEDGLLDSNLDRLDKNCLLVPDYNVKFSNGRISVTDKAGNLVFEYQNSTLVLYQEPGSFLNPKVSYSSDGNYFLVSGFPPAFQQDLFLFDREGKLLWTYSIKPENGQLSTGFREPQLSNNGQYLIAGTSDKLYFFEETKSVAKMKLEHVKSMITGMTSISSESSLVDQAEQAYQAGDYVKSITLADKAKNIIEQRLSFEQSKEEPKQTSNSETGSITPSI
jgi:WD40 repeat protein